MSNQKIIAPYILSLLLLWGGEQAVTAQLSQGGGFLIVLCKMKFLPNLWLLAHENL